MLNNRIPKVIHYCWFGNNEKPEIILKCINSWKKFCPDYEIIEWNESNFDVNQNRFMKYAYEKKKWAFVSDVARLIVIYKYGGIYLDTDVELNSNIDELLQYDTFFAFESIRYIASGLGFGSIKESDILKKMIDTYNVATLDEDKLIPCPIYNTKVLKQYLPTLELNGKTQVINDNMFLSMEAYSKYAKHLGAQSWIEGPKFEA